MADVLLEARDVHKAYRRLGTSVAVLSGVDLSIARGERVAIVGASGAGKSTLLHVLGTLDHVDAGDVRFLNESLLGQSQERLAAFRNESLGFVFQFHHLLPDFDAVENVMMPSLIARVPTARARMLAVEALERVSMSHRLTHRPQALSGGEQQRVALARAIVRKPPLLLLDEVTGNLDAQTAEGIHRLLLELNETLQTTLVAVTHNEALAALFPRRMLLAGGRLTQAASASATRDAS